VAFTPTTTGSRAGTLTVSSSDPGSPLVVPLTGNGMAAASFTLTVNGAASASVSVTSGEPATYELAITPSGGFTDQLR